MRRFIGMLNFYRESIPKASHCQINLNKFLGHAKKRDKTPIVWDPEAEQAFEECKEKLERLALLAYPDEKAEIRLVCDASDLALGSTLEQRVGPNWQPLAFFSQKFKPAQVKYATYDRELMAIEKSVKHFHFLLESKSFEVLTDHKPIIYSQTHSHDTAPAHRIRRVTYSSQFNIKYSHVKGEDNVVADALSRIASLSGPVSQPLTANVFSIQFPTIFNTEQQQKFQAEDPELDRILRNPDHPLKLVKIKWDPGDLELYCNIDSHKIRPYIPLALRHELIRLYHAQSHPSARATEKLLKQNYVWPHATRDIASYCRTCLACQMSKISRHNKTKPAKFDLPDERFQHVHVDIVGPLLPSNGFRYLLTIIDRFSRWPEAIPMVEMTAETVAHAFYDNWVSRYGAPVLITTDQGTQFESAFFAELLKILGLERIHTTPYHPESNGLVEKWHRHLKAALMCVCINNTDWYFKLPTVLLGLRTTVRLDTGVSPAEVLFG